MLSLKEIIQSIGGEVCQKGSATRVSRVLIDSRQIKKGSLFFAIKGQRLDGHAFIQKAVESGASVIVISDKQNYPSGVWVIRVKDTTVAFGNLAAYYRKKFDIPVVGITGSAGKTTTKEMIASVLSRQFVVLKNHKTENNQYGVPLTLFNLRPRHQAVIIELGTNHFGEMKYLARIAQPTIAVMTNIGASHLEFLKTPAGVFKEKSDMIRYADPSGWIVFNTDDTYLKKVAIKKISQCKIGYGLATGAQVRGQKVMNNGLGRMTFSVGKQEFVLNSATGHNVHNALAAVAVGRILKIHPDNIAAGLMRWRPEVGRQCYIKRGGVWIIDDTYNANPISFKSALTTLAGLKTKGRKILICGDMKELGPDTVKWHKEIGYVAAGCGIDTIFSLGENAHHIGETAQSKKAEIQVHAPKNMEDMLLLLKSFLIKGDRILVKGSRSMKMERIVDFLKTRLFPGNV